MADISKLKEDVNWWKVEIDIRKKKVDEAVDKYETRKKELSKALEEERGNPKK
ncbi:MAG: hypothetical protein WC059_01260 [Candidatus Paceibacterota bacterium]